MNKTDFQYDTIPGGGPAGLSAALMLGRRRRKVLLCNAGKLRNARTLATYSFFTNDGIKPAELIRIAREQLSRYETVELLDIEVKSANGLNSVLTRLNYPLKIIFDFR